MVKSSFFEFNDTLENFLTSNDMHSDIRNFSNGRVAGIVTRVSNTSLLDQQKGGCSVTLFCDLAYTSSRRVV